MTSENEQRLQASNAFRRHARAKLARAEDAISRAFEALLMDDDYVVERALGELLVFYGAGRDEIDEIIGISLDTLRIGPTYREPETEIAAPSDKQVLDIKRRCDDL